MAEVKKPRHLPKAKKHKPMDSDEDDEVSRNEPGTSSNTQPPVPVLPLRPKLATSSQVPTRPVHKDHRPVPALRMNPLTTMTSTEKEHLAQQYKVHEGMTQEEQCSIHTFTF